jgi:hypothetical protein
MPFTFYSLKATRANVQVLCAHLETQVPRLFPDAKDFEIAVCQQHQKTTGSNEQVG